MGVPVNASAFVSDSGRSASPLVGFMFGRFRVIRDARSGAETSRTHDGRPLGARRATLARTPSPLMILLLRAPATADQIAHMLGDWEVLIKVVVDTRREILSGGGEMHADGEALLLADGSLQEDLWGANWYPASREIRFEALINIRPRQSNRRMRVESDVIRHKMDAVIRRLLEGQS